MGGMGSFLDKLPGMGGSGMQQAVQDANPESAMKGMEAIIQSMTVKERRNPDLINNSRKRRIAAGCGKDIQEVNRLLNQFEQTQKVMKQFSKGGMNKMMRAMKGMMPGGLPGMPR